MSFWSKSEEKCIDCDEKYFLFVCDAGGCKNMSCRQHQWLQPNGDHYCSKCNKIG